MSNNERDLSHLKGQTNLSNCTLEVVDPKAASTSPNESTCKPKLINVTFRKNSRKSEAKSTEDLKKKKAKEDKKAKSKLKKDMKVAKAMAKMSKHFSKVSIGSVGESEYIFFYRCFFIDYMVSK